VTLEGLVVVSFEARRSAEMAALVRKRGGEPLSAPALREVPLSDQHEAFAFGEVLLGGACDVLVLLTGVGTRMLVDALATKHERGAVLEAMRRCTLVCRGPKPVAALREMGLGPQVTVPEPNTWRDLLAAVDGALALTGKRCWVQEYGRRNAELLEGLRARGATVSAVPVYGYALPDDVKPLEHAIAALLEGRAQVATFTTAQHVENLFAIAERMGRATELREALAKRVVVASIGPVTGEALAERGLTADIVPEHPKMGQLIAAVAQRAKSALEEKQRQHSSQPPT
jgi:uroporphyrinogen-III synthase